MFMIDLIQEVWFRERAILRPSGKARQRHGACKSNNRHSRNGSAGPDSNME
jgi:hypothetical protein